MADHRSVIDRNLVTLCDFTNCTKRLLDKCMGIGILTRDESTDIERHLQVYDRNRVLYNVVRRRDAIAFDKFLEVMESEGITQSGDVLEVLRTGLSPQPKQKKKFEILKSKWWPDEKILVNSFHERQINGHLLVEELHKILTTNMSQTAVISQKVTVSGLGGIGKTTTAKWYARQYSDNYDFIIWIDCGEKSVLKSFRELSADLEIKNRGEFHLNKLARECFSRLEDRYCLWIFDNAESYVGNDGIKSVLPNDPNSHAIITSRNRDWGNLTGHGQIRQVQLDVFKQNEAVKFMRTNLHNKACLDSDLMELCELLGNLPLGLQIAVAALNNQNIKLSEYILLLKKTDNILGKNFDDYEKTINATLMSSVDFLKTSNNGLAYNILLIFAYIRPDQVPIEFFQSVEVCKDYEVKDSLDLLETYSLVSVKFSPNITYSIHRLLQQVIRLNNKEMANVTLRKILQSKTTNLLKDIPFTFANDEIKSEFPVLRAKILDQPELCKLILSGDFVNALELSRVIYNTLQTVASSYNYAICLKKCNMLQTTLKWLDDMYFSCIETGHRSSYRSYIDWKTELYELSYVPSKIDIKNQMLLIHLQLGNFNSATNLLEYIGSIACAKSSEHLINKVLKAKKFGTIGYSLYHFQDYFTLYLKTHDIRQIVFEECLLEESPILPCDVQSVHMSKIQLGEEFYKPLMSSASCVPLNLSVLKISFTTWKVHELNPLISLDYLDSLKTLELTNCTIVLTDIVVKMRPKRMVLDNVSFIFNGERMKDILVEKFINFNSLKDLTLSGPGISIQMIGNLNVNIVELNSVKVLDWGRSDWVINRLILSHVTYGKTQMRIGRLDANTSIELQDLPDTLKTLILRDKVKITDFGKTYRPNVKNLYVEFTDDILPHIYLALYKFSNLTAFSCNHLSESANSSLDLDTLPQTVRTLHLFRVMVTGKGLRPIQKLVLSKYTISDVEETLNKVKPNQLVLESHIDTLEEHRSLVELIQCYHFESLVVGYINWYENFNESPLYFYTDSIGEIYVFERCRKGRLIRIDEFEINFKFPPVLYVML